MEFAPSTSLGKKDIFEELCAIRIVQCFGGIRLQQFCRGACSENMICLLKALRLRPLLISAITMGLADGNQLSTTFPISPA